MKTPPLPSCRTRGLSFVVPEDSGRALYLRCLGPHRRKRHCAQCPPMPSPRCFRMTLREQPRADGHRIGDEEEHRATRARHRERITVERDHDGEPRACPDRRARRPVLGADAAKQPGCRHADVARGRVHTVRLPSEMRTRFLTSIRRRSARTVRQGRQPSPMDAPPAAENAIWNGATVSAVS